MNVVHASSLTGIVVLERLQVHGKTEKEERFPIPPTLQHDPLPRQNVLLL